MKECSKRMLTVVAGVILMAIASSVWALPATFRSLGDPAGGEFPESSAYGVSADGSTVVGTWDRGPPSKAFRWTLNGGMADLGIANYCDGVSADGSVVVGKSNREAFRWTEESGMVGLGFPPNAGGHTNSTASDVSADGSVVVGFGSMVSGVEAFRWTEAEGMVGLGSLVTAERMRSYAYGVSPDGAVVVGRAGHNPSGGGNQAFRWTRETGMVGLGFLSTEVWNISSAYAISADGLTVVGDSIVPGSNPFWGDPHAFRWTKQTGMVDLGWLPGASQPWSYAFDVSADGSVVVGMSLSSDPRGVWNAYIWDQTNGMRSLHDVLVS